MPEGAEVKIIGEGLSKLVSGKELIDIVYLSGRYQKNGTGIDGERLLRNNFGQISPQKIAGVGVKGKLIFWIIENGTFVLNTLGMTGSWSTDLQKHSRVRFDFDEGEPVYFNDVRNFGTLKIIEGKAKFKEKLASLGPDMLSDFMSDDLFALTISEHPKKTLAELLMNQEIMSGVGNYVKAESLWLAKLSPHRTVESLSWDEISTLCKSIVKTLKKSYEEKGASLKDFKSVEGEKGTAALSFNVYGKKKDPNGNDVIKEKTLDGRVTHWVPKHQI